MDVPSRPLQVDGEVGSKRKLNPDDDGRTPTKRGKHRPIDGSATRPTTSGEHLWNSPYTKLSLYCSEADKKIFGVHFQRTRKKTSASQEKSLYEPSRLSIVKELGYHYGEAGRIAMTSLLAPYGLQPREGRQKTRLQLRYGNSTSKVYTDGVFHDPSTGSVVAYTEFAKMAQRRAKHPMTLLPTAKGEEEKENRRRRAEEYARIRPQKDEEDAQIALMMAAMAQEMLRSGDRGRPGAWARVIGSGDNEIFMYRSWVPRRFVETFEADNGFVVEYRSISLLDERRVINQLDCLLKERSPPSDQPGAAAAAKHWKL